MTKKQWEEIDEALKDIMCQHGDGHIDGHREITDFIMKTREEAIEEVIGYVAYSCIEDENLAKQIYDKLYNKYIQNINNNK